MASSGGWLPEQHGPGGGVHRGQYHPTQYQSNRRSFVLQIRIPSNHTSFRIDGSHRIRAHHRRPFISSRGIPLRSIQFIHWKIQFIQIHPNTFSITHLITDYLTRNGQWLTTTIAIKPDRIDAYQSDGHHLKNKSMQTSAWVICALMKSRRPRRPLITQLSNDACFNDGSCRSSDSIRNCTALTARPSIVRTAS